MLVKGRDALYGIIFPDAGCLPFTLLLTGYPCTDYKN